MGRAETYFAFQTLTHAHAGMHACERKTVTDNNHNHEGSSTPSTVLHTDVFIITLFGYMYGTALKEHSHKH